MYICNGYLYFRTWNNEDIILDVNDLAIVDIRMYPMGLGAKIYSRKGDYEGPCTPIECEEIRKEIDKILESRFKKGT